MLRKHEVDSSRVLDILKIQINDQMSYEGRPVQLLDGRDKQCRSKIIPLVKV